MDRRIRHLAAATTGLTFVLILLGLHTGATGGGLSCGTRWPLCDGWLGLFPADWASFFEWFHRLVAMVVGFLLLGFLYAVWRGQDDRRVRYGVTAAIAILPVQILLGGVTTTAGGLFPGGFNPVVMIAHFSTATAIFLLLVYATARLFDAPTVGRIRRLTLAALVLALVSAVFEIARPFAHQPANQAGYYAASFALFGLLVALLTWSDETIDPSSLGRFRAVAVGATAVLFVDMVLSRRKFGIDPLAGEVTTVLLAVLVVGVALVVARSIGGTDDYRVQRAD